MSNFRNIHIFPRLAMTTTITTLRRQRHRRTAAPGAEAAAVRPATKPMPRSTGTRSCCGSNTISCSHHFAKEYTVMYLTICIVMCIDKTCAIFGKFVTLWDRRLGRRGLIHGHEQYTLHYIICTYNYTLFIISSLQNIYYSRVWFDLYHVLIESHLRNKK